MINYINKILLLSLLLTAALTLSACEGFIETNNTVNAQDNEDSNDLERKTIATSAYFDSYVQIDIYHRDIEENMKELEENVLDLMQELHQMGTWIDSFEGVTNVKTINDNPGEFHEVDERLFDMFKLSVEYYELTDGYFDITLGPVIDLWDQYRNDCQAYRMSHSSSDISDEQYEKDKPFYCSVPSMRELNVANENVGIDGITLDEENLSVMIEEGMKLDLGGIGKGYAAKVVADYLKTYDTIDSFLLNAGTSNVEVYGDHPFRENKMWYTGMTDPNNQLQRFGSLKITSGDNVTTSGDYQRYYEIDGQRYHHLIDPFTLRPTDHHRSVTLVSADGSIGDILVTALFIMSLEEGLEFVNERDGLEALWYIDSSTVEMSDNFEEMYLRDLNLGGLDNGETTNTGLIIALLIPGIGLVIFSILSLLYQKGIIKLPFVNKK